MPRTIPFARYVFQRLRQLNCHTVHGVPGDFFLRALDHISPSGLKWIGNANELCAGYAADGYARVMGRLSRQRAAQNDRSHVAMVGALMTTYGVGELSAINALAGSYAESVPVVHFVGTPSRKAMRSGNRQRPVHHTLADGRMDMYVEMAKHITCGQAILHQMENTTEAAEAYDEALEKALRFSKPVYVSVPSDLVDASVPEDMLDKAINIVPPPNEPKAEEVLISQMLESLRKAKSPLIIADGLSYSMNIQSEINELISLTGMPGMSFTSGKGIINESLPSWNPALPNTTEYSQTADMVLIFGPLLSDTNTARWSAIPATDNIVLFNLDSVEMAGEVYKGIRSKSLLRGLISKIKKNKLAIRGMVMNSSVSQKNDHQPLQSKNGRIAQDELWPMLSSYLQPDDTLLLANGTPLIGARAFHLQAGSQVLASAIWNAIGSMLPAAQGIAAAKRDHQLPGRTILFEGDGSFQVTCQSISDIIRYKLDITIFMINNAGYTYERWLNGMEAEYNDVPSWRYTEAASFFGARENDANYPIFMRRVETWAQFEEVLGEEKARDGRGLKLIDVVVDPQDVPEKAKAGLRKASEALRSA